MTVFYRILLTAGLSLLVAAGASAQEDAIWIDVRTEAEYAEDHINGDPNIPLASIDTAALAARFGKDTEINLYCRSGNRAGQAKSLLEAAGFTNVNNVGGINDVRSLRQIAQSSANQGESTVDSELVRSQGNQ